jgi:hypothetical protein
VKAQYTSPLHRFLGLAPFHPSPSVPHPLPLTWLLPGIHDRPPVNRDRPVDPPGPGPVPMRVPPDCLIGQPYSVSPFSSMLEPGRQDHAQGAQRPTQFPTQSHHRELQAHKAGAIMCLFHVCLCPKEWIACMASYAGINVCGDDVRRGSCREMQEPNTVQGFHPETGASINGIQNRCFLLLEAPYFLRF